jgi:hypothetical protein
LLGQAPPLKLVPNPPELCIDESDFTAIEIATRPLDLLGWWLVRKMRVVEVKPGEERLGRPPCKPMRELVDNPIRGNLSLEGDKETGGSE